MNVKDCVVLYTSVTHRRFIAISKYCTTFCKTWQKLSVTLFDEVFFLTMLVLVESHFFVGRNPNNATSVPQILLACLCQTQRAELKKSEGK